MYTTQFALDSIVILENELSDLDKWSVYNDDVCNAELHEIENQLAKIKERLLNEND